MHVSMFMLHTALQTTTKALTACSLGYKMQEPEHFNTLVMKVTYAVYQTYLFQLKNKPLQALSNTLTVDESDYL